MDAFADYLHNFLRLKLKRGTVISYYSQGCSGSTPLAIIWSIQTPNADKYG